MKKYVIYDNSSNSGRNYIGSLEENCYEEEALWFDDSFEAEKYILENKFGDWAEVVEIFADNYSKLSTLSIDELIELKEEGYTHYVCIDGLYNYVINENGRWSWKDAIEQICSDENIEINLFDIDSNEKIIGCPLIESEFDWILDN